jgi:DNA-binding LytR/AlgR family response regulator
MTILIIEDEPQAAQRLEKLLGNIQPTAHVVDKIDSVKRSVEWLKTHAAPDLILMDIQLADGISFQIFEQVVVQSPVIFTTAYNEFALKAFKVNSIDYLLKPIDPPEFAAALKKYETLQRPTAPDKMLESIANAMLLLTRKYKERFMVKVGEHLRALEVSEILFFFSLDKATFAQTKDGRKHILDYTIDQLEEVLDPQAFFRINRKYLVASYAIQDMISHVNSRLKLVLKTSDDPDVIVARERVQEFKDWMDR